LASIEYNQPRTVITNPELSVLQALLTTFETSLTEIINLLSFAEPDPIQGIWIDRNVGITIPLVVEARTNNADLTVRVSSSTPIPIDSRTLVFARTAGGTTAGVRGTNTGRERVAINNFFIRENRPGIFPQFPDTPVNLPNFATPEEDGVNWVFELVAPGGWSFDGPLGEGIEGVRVFTEGGIRNIQSHWSDRNNNNSGDFGIVRFVPGTNNRVIAIGWSELTPSTALPGTLVIYGLSLVSNNPDRASRDGEDLYVEVRNLEHRNGPVSRETVRIGTSRDFAVQFQTQPANATIPQLVNGKLDSIFDHDTRDREHAAATLRIRELVPNSLWNGRDIVITLPSEVRVRKAQFSEGQNVANFGDLLGNNRWFYNDRGRENNTWRGTSAGNTPEVRINDNVITVRNLQRSGTGNFGFDLSLWLNVEAGFEGDIDATLSGGALNALEIPAPVTIATAINPITINANLNNVRMGYTFVPVGNFSITENVAGALEVNEELYVSVTDEFFSEIHIGANFTAAVTEGDLEIRGVRASNNLGIFNNFNNNLNWRLGTNAIVEIARESTKPFNNNI